MSAERFWLGDFGHEPEPAVLELLRVLSGAAPATEAARRLLVSAATGEADRGVLKLLPLARGNAELVVSLSPEAQAGIERSYLKARTNFLRLENAARMVSNGLGDAGIPAMFLKGFALASRFYPNPANRPMGDLDIAVPHVAYREAIHVLEGLGFDEVQRATRHSRPTAGLSTHAFPFRDQQRQVSLDLHYNILNCSLWERADDGFWAEAEPLGQPGFDTALTLAPEHHLFHACVHGYARSLLQLSIRWMLDAHLILMRLGPSFRWHLVEEEAQRHRCGPLIAATLRYLADNFSTAVPAEVLARLADQDMPEFDRAYFTGVAGLNKAAGFRRRLGIAWNACQRQLGYRFATPLPFVVQMARRWGAASPRQLFLEGARHLAEPRFMREKRKLSAPRGKH